MTSFLAVFVDEHTEVSDETCWKCGARVREIFPRPCQNDCCDLPWCLDCVAAEGIEIR